MRRKSTERYRLTLPDGMIQMLAVSADHLQKVRLVDHTLCDALSVAMHFCARSMSTTMKIMMRFYVASNEPKSTMQISLEVKKRIESEAKKHGVTKQAYVNAVVTLFMSALIGQLRKSALAQADGGNNLHYVLGKKVDVLSLPGVKKPKLTTRKLTLKREEAVMRHHKYVEDFLAYMDNYGGLDSLLNKNISVPIHAHAIEGNVGHPHKTDMPIDANPANEHIVRLWKRGRGYNMTVLQSGNTEHEGAPSLEVGSVWRLYDIYRNIDWENITNA